MKHHSDMYREEYNALMEILNGNPWEARTKLKALITSFQIEERPQNVSNHEVEDKNAPRGHFDANKGIVALNLDGTPKPEYPEYTGPVNWTP